MVKVMKVCTPNIIMSRRGEGMECRLIGKIKHSTLRWFGHIEKMPGSEMIEYT